MLKGLLAVLACTVSTCQLPFVIKAGIYGAFDGGKVGATIELDPSYALQKK